MTPQEKIKVFVEEGVKEMRIQRSDYDTQCLREALHRAIAFGLRQALEAGPESIKERVNVDATGAYCRHRPPNNDVCNGCKIHNEALSAKNAAIEELLKGVGV